MKYCTIKEMSGKWDVTPRRIQMLCANGEITGAQKFGRDWLIPKDAEYPADHRRKEFRTYANSGFTLIEMLVVIAIIAVLVAVVIPTVTSGTEKAREATDLANVRSAYSVVSTAALTGDQTMTYNGQPVYLRGQYQINVPLKKQSSTWVTDPSDLSIGGITPSDNGTRWFDNPTKDGVCTVIYEANAAGEQEVHLYWNGNSYNYVQDMQYAVSKTNTNSNCLNSTCASSGTITKLLGTLNGVNDGKTSMDIKSWAAVRDPSDGKTKNVYNYLYSTIDISTVARGTKVPAMYVDKDGNYSVGYATVSKAPDGNYNVMTVSPDGKYAAENNKTYDINFKSSTLISDATSYTNRTSAQAAYDVLVKEYEGGL